MKKVGKINIVIFNGGLFQVYQNPKENYRNYNEIIKKYTKMLLNNFPNITEESLSNLFEKYLEKTWGCKKVEELFQDFDKELKKLCGDDSYSDILFKASEYETIPKKYLDTLSETTNVYFVHENCLHLIIDYKILYSLQMENGIIFILREDLRINTSIEKTPKHFICFDYNLVNLHNYHDYGCWTIYLCPFIKMNLENNKDEYFDNLNIFNLKILKKYKKFFDFSLFFFIQLTNYISYIKEVNKKIKGAQCDPNKLEEELNSKNLVNCLVFYRYFFKAGEIKRAHLFICNDKVNFISYFGSFGQVDFDNLLDLNLCGKFQCILPKFCDPQDIKYFSKIINTIQQYLKDNNNIFSFCNLGNKDIYLKRELMINFMNDFTKNLNDSKILIPKSFSVHYKDVYEYEQFKSFMDKNELKFPLMLKFEGPTKNYNHLMINIITDEGLKNYIEYMKNYSKGKENEITQIIQTFINHGGYVIKMYRINKKNYFFYRPSFPDVSPDLVNEFEEYKRGFFETSTSVLTKDEFKNFWEKVGRKKDVKQEIGEKGENFLSIVSDKFEDIVKDTLFGLDFIYDYEKKVYYLIDMNQFPGYKELIPVMNNIISEHIINYYNSTRK